MLDFYTMLAAGLFIDHLLVFPSIMLTIYILTRLMCFHLAVIIIIMVTPSVVLLDNHTTNMDRKRKAKSRVMAGSGKMLRMRGVGGKVTMLTI